MQHRKQFLLTNAERDAMAQRAKKEGTTLSSLGRKWIEEFIEEGSNYSHGGEYGLQIIIPRETAEAAEKKAREEYGVSLREIFLHRIRRLPN